MRTIVKYRFTTTLGKYCLLITNPYPPFAVLSRIKSLRRAATWCALRVGFPDGKLRRYWLFTIHC